MPSRDLKPGIIHSLRWNGLSWPAQSMFVRLIALVDDFAVYDAHLELLASVCFPYGGPSGKRVTGQHVELYLKEMADLDLILRYEHEGHPYLKIQRWTERRRSIYPRFPLPAGTICGQLPSSADLVDSNRQQMSLSTTTTPTTTPTTVQAERENGAGAADTPKPDPSKQVSASIIQAGLFERQRQDLEKKLAENKHLSPEDRAELAEVKRKLAVIQEGQKNGVFKPIQFNPVPG